MQQLNGLVQQVNMHTQTWRLFSWLCWDILCTETIYSTSMLIVANEYQITRLIALIRTQPPSGTM